MRITRPRDEMKFNATGCIILPASLFIGLMIATAGVAIWPKLAEPGAAILCGNGEIVHQSFEYSRPGEYSVSRVIYCQTGEGKTGTREEITLSAMGVSFLIYAAGIFLLLQFAVRPLLAWRWRRRMEAMGIARPGTSMQGAPAHEAVDLTDILARVSDAVRRGEADVQVRNASMDTGGGDIAARLAQLKALRDQGLITAQDYEARKAGILSEL